VANTWIDHHHHHPHQHLFPDSFLNQLPTSMLDHPPQPSFTPANPSTTSHTHPSPTFSSSSSSANHPSYSPSSASSRNGIKKPSSKKAPTKKVSSVAPAQGGEEVADEEEDTLVKRQRNTMAARRYRQRKADKLGELEYLLAEMTAERDELTVKLARREAEVGALREVLAAKR
jgi:hypothetical protein